MKRITIAALTALAPPLTGAQLRAEEILQLHFHERIPYQHSLDDGSIAGFVATPAARALASAGIPFRWVHTPPKRQLLLIEENREFACLTGWFRNPERERSGRFTAPLYRDRPTLTVARTGSLTANAPLTIAELLRDVRFKPLLKEGYSYGAFIDGLIASSRPAAIYTTSDNVGMLHMLRAGRADYLFLGEDEYLPLLREARLPIAALETVRLADAPPGNTRHLWCTFRVPEALIERINAAIARQTAATPR